mgnify:CR=1 FL=1
MSDVCFWCRCLCLMSQVVHCYGHGGIGVTLHWGCAGQVIEHVKTALSLPVKSKLWWTSSGTCELYDLQLMTTSNCWTEWIIFLFHIQSGIWLVTVARYRTKPLLHQVSAIVIQFFMLYLNFILKLWVFFYNLLEYIKQASNGSHLVVSRNSARLYLLGELFFMSSTTIHFISFHPLPIWTECTECTDWKLGYV